LPLTFMLIAIMSPLSVTLEGRKRLLEKREVERVEYSKVCC
jgi:hypothetical protein